MKEAFVNPDIPTTLKDSPIPTPAANQLVIKVVVAGCNPKDWKLPMITKQSANEGDDIAGYVHEVGDGVTEFKKGDRVAAFHEMRQPHGAYAEYAVAWEHTTFRVPETTSLEEAATIPLAAYTAVLGLYKHLALPQPWTPNVDTSDEPSATPKLPLIIYGASTAVGAFAIKLASHSEIHPIIAIAGKGAPYVETLIDRSKGDTIIDYRNGSDSIVTGVQAALKAAGLPEGTKVLHAYDAVSEHGSYDTIFKILDEGKGAKMTYVLGPPENKGETKRERTMVSHVHESNKLLGAIFAKYFERGLKEGWFKGHPAEVIDGGLESGVAKALTGLKEGKASAVKYVIEVSKE